MIKFQEETLMQDFKECFGNVQQYGINLFSISKSMGKIVDCQQELRFAECCFLNPNWRSDNRPWLSRWLIIWLWMICSIVLQMMDVRDWTVVWRRVAVPFFGDWCRMGRFPIMRDLTLMQSRLKEQGENWSQFSCPLFSKHAGRPSGPAAVWGLIFDRSFWPP